MGGHDPRVEWEVGGEGRGLQTLRCIRIYLVSLLKHGFLVPTQEVSFIRSWGAGADTTFLTSVRGGTQAIVSTFFSPFPLQRVLGFFFPRVVTRSDIFYKDHSIVYCK